MLPVLRNRDIVLLRTIEGNIKKLKVGNFVLAEVPNYGLIVKKIIKISSAHLELSGLSPSSLAPQHIGPVPHSSIVGVLTAKIYPMPFVRLV